MNFRKLIGLHLTVWMYYIAQLALVYKFINQLSIYATF